MATDHGRPRAGRMCLGGSKGLASNLRRSRRQRADGESNRGGAGATAGTAECVLIAISGDGAARGFAEGWRGTVQWIARSPFRPEQKRKNWFVGVELVAPVEAANFDSRDVKWETIRASGPGGQHVNRTESAVRVMQLPTGMQASAMEESSQLRHRKIGLARLARKLSEREANQ